MKSRCILAINRQKIKNSFVFSFFSPRISRHSYTVSNILPQTRITGRLTCLHWPAALVRLILTCFSLFVLYCRISGRDREERRLVSFQRGLQQRGEKISVNERPLLRFYVFRINGNFYFFIFML